MKETRVNLGDFRDSLNFITGFASLEEGFDIEVNPYIEIIGYELSQSLESPGSLVVDARYPLHRCNTSEQASFLKPHTADWYPQPLCFANRDDVDINANWF